MDNNRFGESRIVVHALKGEPIGRLNRVVIGLLKIGLMGWVLGVVLVRGKRRPVASRGGDFDNDETFCFLVSIQDVLYTAVRVSSTATSMLMSCGRSTRARRCQYTENEIECQPAVSWVISTVRRIPVA
jgi:hypothetical protein